MKFIKTTALLSLFFSFIISSCEREDQLKRIDVFSKTGIVLSGAQVVPASTTAATGTMDVSYDKRTQTLNYKVTWSQLTGSPTGIGLYGLAPKGYAVLPTAPTQVISTTGLTASGTLSGSLLADGVYIKEEDILNGLYYFMIRTTANPAGELRAQVLFQ
jgi:hypothetical protein